MSHRVTFWGVRGSIPTPGPGTARYGGNTPCLSVTNGRSGLVILDAGSGLRGLGHELMQTLGGESLRADLLLSHTHWDHIQGLPFFKPLSAGGNQVRIFGAAQEGVPLEDILGRQMDPMVFPVPLRALAAHIEVVEVEPGAFSIDGFSVEAVRLRHPGTTLGYILEPSGGGRRFAYLTDNELGAGGSYPVPPRWRDTLIERLGGVDTLIHDAMYVDQMIEARAGWGHSTARQAVDLAAAAGVQRLLLFHYEPEHDDRTMDGILADARGYAATAAPSLVVDPATEGLTFTL
ncbi:MAG TPA: MBL fold metallo-hydrolase [Gemmatimonadales bacterium]|nr:MBL fold metallo-hydrolase [Gemmatimonadales bacterium]